MAIERWELKVKNEQNFFGEWRLDIIKVKSDPTFFSGHSQLVIEIEKQNKVNHQVNHQSPEIWELADGPGGAIPTWSCSGFAAVIFLLVLPAPSKIASAPSCLISRNLQKNAPLQKNFPAVFPNDVQKFL